VSEVQKLPKGWVWTTLGEVCSRPQYGWTTKAERQSGQVKLLRTTDISSGSIDWNTVPYCTNIPENLEDYKLYSGDIVISRAGSIGISHLLTTVPLEAVFASYLIRFQPSKNIDSQFMAYYLQTPSYWDAVHEQSSGIALANVNARKLEALSFPLAPYAEQQRIVEALEQQLSRLDAGVAALRSAQQKLKRYRAAVLKAAVEGKLTEKWRKSHPEIEPAPELLKRILAERRAKWEEEQRAKGRDLQKMKYDEPVGPDVKSLSELPEGWCWATLEQITSEVRPICYGILMPKENVPNGIPYVKVKDMKGDKIDIPALHKTAPEIAAKYSRASLRLGDLLLAIRGTYGRVAEVPDELEGANITQDTARLDIAKQVNQTYIATYLRSPISQKYFQKVSRGVAVKGVNIADVKLTPVMLPSLAEQEQITLLVEERLSIVSTLESTIGQTLKRAERMRQSILHRAFTGQLVAQEPNDEPASVLLERIRREREEARPPQKLERPARKTRVKSPSKRVAEHVQPYLPLDIPDPEPVDAETMKQGELWDYMET
jgi:type I restriction enzyme, S subunit